jgi:hypothetical protein
VDEEKTAIECIDVRFSAFCHYLSKSCRNIVVYAHSACRSSNFPPA